MGKARAGQLTAAPINNEGDRNVDVLCATPPGFFRARFRPVVGLRRRTGGHRVVLFHGEVALLRAATLTREERETICAALDRLFDQLAAHVTNSGEPPRYRQGTVISWDDGSTFTYDLLLAPMTVDEAIAWLVRVEG